MKPLAKSTERRLGLTKAERLYFRALAREKKAEQIRRAALARRVERGA